MFSSFTSPLLLICPILRFFNLQNRLLQHNSCRHPQFLLPFLSSITWQNLLNMSLGGRGPHHVLVASPVVQQSHRSLSRPPILNYFQLFSSAQLYYCSFHNSHPLRSQLPLFSLDTHTHTHPHDSPFPMMPSNIDRPVDTRNHVHSNTL